MKRLNQVLLGILGLVLAFIPFAVAFSNGNADPFLFGIVASTIRYESVAHIPLESTQFGNVPGLGLLLIMMKYTTGLDPQLLLYTPIAGPFLVLAAFVLARRFTHPMTFSIAIALTVGFRWIPPTLSTLWPHTFGFALYLLFVAIYLRMGSSKQWIYLVALWTLYLGIHLFSYTAELWTISFVGALAIMRLVRREPIRSATSSLLLALLVTFFGFTEIIYAGFIPRVETATSEFGVGMQALFSSLFRAAAAVPYGWVPPATPAGILALQVGWYLGIFLPPALVLLDGFLGHRKNHARRRLLAVPTAVIGFFMVWPVDAAAYALLGQLSIGVFRYSTLAALFLTVPATRRIDETRVRPRWGKSQVRIAHVLALFLVVASVMLFVSASTQQISIASPTKYNAADSGAAWLLRSEPGVNHIYSDHLTQGEFAIVAARFGLTFESNNLYNSTLYESLLGVPPSGSSGSPFSGQYVVVNLEIAKFKTSAGGWIDYEPLSQHLAQISANPNLSLIYSDGNTWIMRGSS